MAITMLSKFKRWWSDQRGTATLEMGLTIPLLMLVMFPPMEYARYSYADRILRTSVDEAAKFAALTLTLPNTTYTEEDVRDLVIEKAGRFAPARDAIIISYSPAREPGARVTVSATAEFDELFEKASSNVFGDISHSVSGTRTLYGFILPNSEVGTGT